MVARLGAVTGAGHARLIVERFGRRWGAFAVGDLLALNALTIVTDFIGVALALGYFGVSRYVAVPVAAALLIAVTATGSFRRWERTMYVLIAVSLAVIPLALLTHAGSRLAGSGSAGLRPGVEGGVSSTSVLLIIALAGTTVAPWQLFFQQSNVVDKRITPRWLAYERVDTLIGTHPARRRRRRRHARLRLGLRRLAAARSVHRHRRGRQRPVQPASRRSPARSSPIALLDASLLGAAAVTLASSYAIGDYLGYKQSLHRSWRDATVFHGTYAAPSSPSARSSCSFPGHRSDSSPPASRPSRACCCPAPPSSCCCSATTAQVLGPWVNPRWLNALAALVVGVLVALSTALTITTIFPHADLTTVGGALLVGLALALAAVAFTARSSGSRPVHVTAAAERHAWTMPPLESLSPPPPSRARRLALVILRAQLLIAAALLLAKLVQLGLAA